jgi:hypothetical protein
MVTEPTTKPAAPGERRVDRTGRSFGRDRMEAAAAEAAVAWAQHHMIVGLGSGSAASLVVSLLGKRVAQGESLGSSVLRRQPNA